MKLLFTNTIILDVLVKFSRLYTHLLIYLDFSSDFNVTLYEAILFSPLCILMWTLQCLQSRVSNHKVCIYKVIFIIHFQRIIEPISYKRVAYIDHQTYKKTFAMIPVAIIKGSLQWFSLVTRDFICVGKKCHIGVMYSLFIRVMVRRALK